MAQLPDLVLDDKYLYTAAEREYNASAAWQEEFSLAKAAAKIWFHHQRHQQLAERTWICSAVPGEVWEMIHGT